MSVDTCITGISLTPSFLTFIESPNDLVDVSHDQRTSSHDSFQKLSVRLLKDVSKGLGINIVDLKESSGESSAGRSSRIAIESVIKGGPADMDGKLKRGNSLCPSQLFIIKFLMM